MSVVSELISSCLGLVVSWRSALIYKVSSSTELRSEGAQTGKEWMRVDAVSPTAAAGSAMYRSVSRSSVASARLNYRARDGGLEVRVDRARVSAGLQTAVRMRNRRAHGAYGDWVLGACALQSTHTPAECARLQARDDSPQPVIRSAIARSSKQCL